MLFRKKDDRKPELPQREREAIVDLLHLCMYADAHIALNEGDVLSHIVDVIGWETQSSFSSYESRSVAHARAARQDPEERREFIARAAARLKTKEGRAIALDLCQQLFAADGRQARRETEMLDEIRAALQ